MCACAMRRIGTVGLAVVLYLQAGGTELAAQDKDLAGTWTAISAERDGAPAGELVGHRIAFAGNHFQISGKEGVLFGGSFTVDAAQAPAHIDFKIEEGAARGQSWMGIFKIENGLLTVCDNAPDPAAPRQPDFGAPKGSAYVCLTFKR